jgi:hypothetical protein
LDREQIRGWYNGYNWTGEAVYNPFDLLLLFDTREFDSYWFRTGTPRFLVDTLLQRQFYLPELQTIEATDNLLSSFEVGALSAEALLFQTGYLTIAATHWVIQRRWFTLRFPNLEVRTSFTEALLQACSPNPRQASTRAARLPALLQAADFPGIQALFRAHFASIPHDWYRNTPIAQYEGYFASVFYTFFASLGLDTIPEDTSSTGRLDLAVRLPGHVYLFEFKVLDDVANGSTPGRSAAPGGTASAGTALAQIKDRGYADKYRTDGVPIHLVGIEFSRQQRNITRFDTQTIP